MCIKCCGVRGAVVYALFGRYEISQRYVELCVVFASVLLVSMCLNVFGNYALSVFDVFVVLCWS